MLNALNFAQGPPLAQGKIKQFPEDFCVNETLSFELAGEGEHLFLLIEKIALNTEEMAKIIARAFNLPFNVIAYAGLKDKFAKTTQWFSLHLPGKKDPDLSPLTTKNHRVLKAIRHNKKLRIGAIKENLFTLRIRQFQGDEKALVPRIEEIKTHGVPNYFGPQRFGHEGNNLVHAKALLLNDKKIKNRHLRGIYYSAARAFLFNEILSQRVREASWNKPLNGDVMMLEGSHSIFPIDTVDDNIIQRVEKNDLSPAAVLWGKGVERLTGDALQCQTSVLKPWEAWCLALERHDLQRAYRSMRLLPKNLHFEGHVFTFALPTGTYATTVLRELLTTNAVQTSNDGSVEV